MKKLLLAILLLITSPCLASVADQVIPSYNTLYGCSGTSSCQKPYGNIGAATTAVAGSSKVFKASGGTLFQFHVTTGATAGYALLYNLAAAPVDGTVTPVACLYIPATETRGLSYVMSPLSLSTGITVVFSSTGCFTQTASATAFISGQFQ